MSEQVDEDIIEILIYQFLEASCLEYFQGGIKKREGCGDGDVWGGREQEALDPGEGQG